MIFIKEFFMAAMAVVGFGLLFNIPKKAFPLAALAGGLGWISYVYFLQVLDSVIGATFMGTCVLAIISEIFARTFKETVTVFTIPAIIPLVPGSGMYYSMLAIIDSDYALFASVGSQTLFIAASISAALLIVSSTTRIVMNIKMKVGTN